MIYFDAAATSFLKPPAVKEAVLQAFDTLGSPGRGGHPLSLAAGRAVFRCRAQLAALFGLADPARVCFAYNATDALSTAIFGLFSPADHVITTALEHNSVLRPLYALEDQGMGLTVLPADREGRIAYEDFPAALRGNTRAVVCTHASNVTGNGLDLARIGAFCRAHGLLFVVDASQSAGVLDIDMQAQNIAVLCFTGHKGLFGPQGTGGLCVAPGVDIRPRRVGGSGVHSFDRHHPGDYPTRLEAGTLNAVGIAGLSAGLDFIEQTGLAAIRAREDALAKQFYMGIRSLPGVVIYGDMDAPLRTAVVAMNLAGEDAGAVADALAEDYGICTRAGAHCAPRMHEALGTDRQGIVRFSFSYFNTEDEVDTAVRAVRELAGA